MKQKLPRDSFPALFSLHSCWDDFGMSRLIHCLEGPNRFCRVFLMPKLEKLNSDYLDEVETSVLILAYLNQLYHP